MKNSIIEEQNIRYICINFLFDDSVKNQVSFYDIWKMQISSNPGDSKVYEAIESALEEKFFFSAVDKLYFDMFNKTIKSEIELPQRIDAKVTIYVLENS